MTSPPPVEFHSGMEVVPGYTLIAPLGSGMAGDVWQAQAAGGIKVALKVVRSLKDVGGRKELKALKTIRDVHHPNLCPLFGFWTKDASGRILADGETEELTLDSVHVIPGMAGGPPEPPNQRPVEGTMAIDPNALDAAFGGGNPSGKSTQDSDRSNEAVTKPKVTAEQLIVVMGLGDCTLYDRLRFIRRDAGLDDNDTETAMGIDATETIRYLRASASAIDLLNHEHDVYHFDIKPQNILLVGGEAQVCDFGLAKKIEADDRATQQTHATPAYACPEILAGEKLSTVSGEKLYVDQYSLAVTYYELRTGLLPFDVTTHANMLVAKATGKLDLSALTPPERKVLQKALAQDPKKRYRSCTEMVTAFAIAAGVDKSGGITPARIVATIAVLLIAMTLGGTGWWYFFPTSFNEWFNQGEIQTAKELLARTQSSFDKTNEQNFTESNSTLVNIVLSEAADLAEKAPEVASTEDEENIRTASQQLYANAAIRLLRRVHETLAEIESSGESLQSSDRRSALSDCLAIFDPAVATTSEQQASVKTSILLGLERWGTADGNAFRQQLQQFRYLLTAGRIRFQLLDQSPVDSVSLDELRELIDGDQPASLDFTTVPESLAAVLLAVGETEGKPIRDWSPNEWLDDERRTDIARAERLTSVQGCREPFLSEWLELREAFVRSVEPVATGAVPTPSLSEQVLDQVRRDFPLLETDRLLAQLRQSVIDDDWNQVSGVLEQLRSADKLDEQRREVIRFITQLQQIPVNVRAMSELLNTLQAMDLSNTKLRALKLVPVVEHFIDNVNEKLVSQSFDSIDVPFDRQAEVLQVIESETAVSVPATAFATPILSALRFPDDRVISSNGKLHPNLAQCMQRLREPKLFPQLVAAVVIEQALRQGDVSPSQIQSAAKLIGVDEPSVLDIVSESYRDFLMVAVSVIQHTPIASADERLRTRSRQSILSLGDWRLVTAADRLAMEAIDVSGVRDEEVDARRYRLTATNRNEVAKASEYLRTGKLLADHLDNAVSYKLESELFLKTVASNENELDRIQVPGILSDRLTGESNNSELTNQILLAIHQVGLASYQSDGDKQRQSRIASQMVLLPAIRILETFGIDKFGPEKSESLSKSSLTRTVVRPTVEEVVLTSIEMDPTGILPVKLIGNQVDPQAVRQFCQLAAVVYSDQSIEKLYQDSSRRIRNAITLSIFGLDPQDQPVPSRQPIFRELSDLFLALEEPKAEAFLSFAKQSASLGADPTMVAWLHAEAFQSLGQETVDPVERAEWFDRSRRQQAVVIQTIDQTSPKTSRLLKLRYESLCESAALGVRLAFLYNDVGKKLPILLDSFELNLQALEAHQAKWDGETDFSLTTIWLTKGNICEDIAFYCSAGATEVEVARREKYFGYAIDAFSEAKKRVPKDLKTQYSLGRALYRQAGFFEGDERLRILDRANDAFDFPPNEENMADDEFKAIEWWTWKMNVELARGFVNEAEQLADRLFQRLSSPRSGDDPRHIDVMWAVALTYGASANASNTDEKWLKLIATLKLAGGRGTPSEFARNMGTLTDLIARSNDPQLFTYILETVKRRQPPQLGFSESDSGSFQMAKVSIHAVSEFSHRLAIGESHPNDTLMVDLSDGARALSRWIDPKTGGEYLKLAELLIDGQQVMMDRDERDAIRFAAELATFTSQSEVLSPYTINACDQVVLFSLGFWFRVATQETSDVPKNRQLTEIKRLYVSEFNDERRAALISSLENSVALASREQLESAAIGRAAINAIKGMK
ncbi:protein kinase domain-containing protein [Rhodopirellula sp. MGV]|uniref:protein kinase domain-containing protein n=1 Tax=Rhodopirellula sp. MGV TaxID=2023130 RepID=UPI000B97AE4C|nr:protein kinase [Rhodopirellula sp. MGV]OYP36856.1 hypothetical protein CGZ80_07355 [Rhodopirellula sp. MGV]PNY34052.1 hypothetical protein C2E31_25325 [Rhodopirellula baltica]